MFKLSAKFLIPLLTLTAILTLFLLNCSDRGIDNSSEITLKIDSISSNQIRPGYIIALYGRFATEEPIFVYFDHHRAKILESDDRTIVVQIPQDVDSDRNIVVVSGDESDIFNPGYYDKIDDVLMQKIQACTAMEITLSAWMTIESYADILGYINADTSEQYMSITFDTRDYSSVSNWNNYDFEFLFDSAYCYADRCTLRVAIETDFSAAGYRINDLSAALSDGYITDVYEIFKQELLFHNLMLADQTDNLTYLCSGPQVESLIDSVLYLGIYWSPMMHTEQATILNIDYQNPDHPPELKVVLYTEP